MQAWKEALEEETNSPQAYYNLGVAYEATGRLYEAKREYERAERLEPKEEYIEAAVNIDRLIQI